MLLQRTVRSDTPLLTSGRIHIVGARLSTCHRACHRGMLSSSLHLSLIYIIDIFVPSLPGRRRCLSVCLSVTNWYHVRTLTGSRDFHQRPVFFKTNCHILGSIPLRGLQTRRLCKSGEQRFSTSKS